MFRLYSCIIASADHLEEIMTIAIFEDVKLLPDGSQGFALVLDGTLFRLNESLVCVNLEFLYDRFSVRAGWLMKYVQMKYL
jgi:hypothetical protein